MDLKSVAYSAIKGCMGKKSWIYLLILLISALFATKALFYSGYYTSHDGWHQVARLYHFDKAIHDRHFPPQWAGGLLNGAGYPLFLFSYHLPWYIAEPFVLFGFSIFDAIKATFIVGFLLSGILMFFYLKDMWTDEAAFLGSFLYLWVPYRFLNIFVRAALGEASCFIFLPLVFWSLYRLQNGLNRKFVIVGAVGVAGLILSHAMIVYLVSISTLLYFLTLLSQTKRKKDYVLHTLSVLLLGFGLSAYYIIPAIFYQPSTMFTQIMKGLYKADFVDISRLVYSPWGFGFSTPGPGAMSLQLGIAQWLTLITSVSMIIFSIINIKKNKYGNWFMPLTIVFSLLISIFLMLKPSLPFWQMVDRFIIVDFPWRMLAVVVFLISILAGWMVHAISDKRLQTMFIISMILIALYTNRNYLRVNEYTNIPLELYIASEKTSNTHDEYLPKWANREFLNKEGKSFIRNADDMSVHDVSIIKETSIQKDFSFTSDKGGDLSVNLLYFPGWKASLDGKEVPIHYDGNGLIQLKIPGGMHNISLRFVDTPITTAGKMVSLFALGIILLLFKKMNSVDSNK